MSTELIDAKKGYGFLVTRFVGPPIGESRTLYQINVGEYYIVLSGKQLRQLQTDPDLTLSLALRV